MKDNNKQKPFSHPAIHLTSKRNASTNQSTILTNATFAKKAKQHHHPLHQCSSVDSVLLSRTSAVLFNKDYKLTTSYRKKNPTTTVWQCKIPFNSNWRNDRFNSIAFLVKLKSLFSLYVKTIFRLFNSVFNACSLMNCIQLILIDWPIYYNRLD